MEMKKINTLLILILILLVVNGCTLGGGKQKTIATDTDYKKGFGAISMKFMERSPLKEIYEENIFSLNLLLENKGANDVEYGVIKIVTEEDYLEIQEISKHDFDIEGKSKEFPKGNQDIITYQLKAKKIPDPESTIHKTHTYITSCYGYQTDFSEDICIDSDVYGLQKDKICSPDELNLNSGQGAPVTITKIETRMFHHTQENTIEPQFTIHIENRGKGNVINQNNLESFCSSNPLEENDLNRLSFSAELYMYGEAISLDCKPENPTKLKNKKRKVICSFTERLNQKEGTYLTPLHIKMNYGYTTTISKDITIKKQLD